jgi:hypothetical protein
VYALTAHTQVLRKVVERGTVHRAYFFEQSASRKETRTRFRLMEPAWLRLRSQPPVCSFLHYGEGPDAAVHF